MSTYYSPKSVTDGLVLCLDAGNGKSYAGSGTAWNDLSGNGNIGTLTNSPTFTSSFGGSIVFDGTNDYVAAGNLGAFYTQGTISYWMYSTAVENYRNPFSTHYLGTNAGIRFEQYTTVSPYGGFNAIIGNDAGTFAFCGYSPTAVLSANTWYEIVLCWNTSTNRATGYLNGASKFDSAHTLWPTTMPSISIGSGFSSDRYFRGYISNVKIYNRALSASEILQNYNSAKARFGL
jgi:hypothetical protein